MEQMKKNDLGKDSIGKLIINLTIPAITAQLINALYNIVDRIYIGRIPEVGGTALTGVGVTFPIVMLISAFGALLGMGGAPKAAIKMGEKNNDAAEEILGNCFSGMIVMATVLTVFFLVFQEPFLMMFGASDKTIVYGLKYLNIYVCGTIFVQATLVLNSFITAQGFARTGMLTVLIGAVLNIILDPILIFYFKMGVQGAAVATVVSQAVSAIWVTKFLIGKNTKIKIKKEYFKIKKSVIIPIIGLGLSPFVMQSTNSVVNVVLNSSLQKFGGDLAVGAMTICGSVIQVLQMPVFGLAQGVQPIVSYNYGARNIDRVKKAYKILLFMSMGYCGIAWLIEILFPAMFVTMFTEDKELIKFTVWALNIYGAGLFMMGVQVPCQQTFVALGEAKVSLILSLLKKIILLVPFALIFPFFFENKVFAVFLAEPVAGILAASITATVFSIRFPKLLKRRAIG